MIIPTITTVVLAQLLTRETIRIDYTYDASGKLTAAKDQFGHALELGKVQAVNQVATKKLAATAPLEVKYNFDAQGRIKSETTQGVAGNYEYDKAGQLASITGPEGRTACDYDAFGRITTIHEPGGAVTRFEHNNLDLPTLVVKPDGSSEKIKYDEHGRVLRRERGPMDWEEVTYDDTGRVATRRKPPAAEEHYFYDDKDRATRVTYSNGNEVKYEYDSAGRPTSQSWSSGERPTWRYDPEGKLIESVNPSGLKTTYTYDKSGQLVAVADSIHGKTTYQQSETGEVIQNAQGKTTTRRTAWGKPLEIIAPGGARTVFNYDARGLLQQVLSPMNVPWRYEYDPARNLTTIIAPSRARASTTWDGSGRRTKVARGNVTWREYHYGKSGYLEEELSGTGRAARYTYDNNGRLAETELPDGKVAQVTDKNGLHLTRKGTGYEVEDEYNADGTLLRRKYNSAALEIRLPADKAGAAGIELNDLKATYSYDGRGQLSEIALPGGAKVSVGHDEAGRPSQFSFNKSVVETITYDKADRITLIEAKQTSGKGVFSERYTYDVAGNLSEHAGDSLPPAKFEYDRGGRLTRASSVKGTRNYTYDVDGNMTTNGDGSHRCRLDELGRPVEQEATSYSWDKGGNLAQVRSLKDTITNTFDSAGRLIERREGKKDWKYGYDNRNDRLWEDSAGSKRWFAYLDDRLAGLKDESGTSWLVVYYPGTDRPLALCGSNNQTFFVLTDKLGSTRRYLDTNGAVVASDDYGVFGQVLASKGKKPVAIYAGMLRDETGLFYARQRYYDPTIARFLSIDPLLGTPGNPESHNAYSYASNNPLRYRDPMGTGSFASEVDGAVYDSLTGAEQLATQQAWSAKQAAIRAAENPSSTAAEVKAATEAIAQQDAALNRLNDIGRARYGHSVYRFGTDKGFGGAGSDAKMAEYEQKITDLGADPLAHYSEETQAKIAAEKAAGLKPSETDAAKAAAAAAKEDHEAWLAEQAAEADAAARDAAAQGAFERGSKTEPLAKADAGNNTAAVAANDAGNAANKTAPLKSATEGGDTASVTNPPTQSELAASARQKLQQGLDNNQAINISKEEMAAYKAEEAAKAAAGTSNETASVPKTQTDGSTSAGTENGSSTNWDDQRFAGKPGINKDGSIPNSGEGNAGAPSPKGDIEMTYDAGSGKWIPKPISGAGEAGEIGERYLGPRIIEAGGKILKPLEKIAPVLEGVQAGEAGGQLAQNFVDNLNQPFMQEQKEKDGARWQGDRYANQLKQLAAADPSKVITNDGHPFDPNNPQDMHDLMLGLSQNLYFKRKPFEGLLTSITDKATTFMGPAKGDTAAATALSDAWKVMQDAISADKDATEAAKECIKQQNEAQSQLQDAVKIAGLRGVAESDLSTLPVKADDLKKQTAAVIEQTKNMQAAFQEMRDAMDKCDEAGLKVCQWANEAASGATVDKINELRTKATNELIGATNLLNAAQAKLDATDISFDQLRASTSALTGMQTAFLAYKLGSGAADSADATPDGALAAAKAAAKLASAAREKVDFLSQRVQTLSSQVSQIVAPFIDSDAEAAALDTSAQALGKDIPATGMFDFGTLLTMASPIIDAALANQKAVEKAIANVDLDAVLSAANDALTSADAERRGAKELASGPDRYKALQNASTCMAMMATAEKQAAEATPTPTPSSGADSSKSSTDDLVAVPPVYGLDTAASTISDAGFTPSFAAVATPADKPYLELKIAGQSPGAGEMKARGSVVTVYVYQKASDSTVSSAPIPVAANAKSSTDALVAVPAIDSIDTASAVITGAGFTPSIAALPPPDKSLELKLAGQSPAAGEMKARGSVVTVYVYQKASDSMATDGSTTKPSDLPTTTGKTISMPELRGLTLDQATTRLGKNMRIGGDEVGDKPPTPEKALTIYLQSPAANSTIDPTKGEVVVTVKRYGSAKVEAPPPPPAVAGDPFAIMDQIEKKFQHYYLDFNEAGKQLGKRLAMGDFTFSIRNRKDGKRIIFTRAHPLRS